MQQAIHAAADFAVAAVHNGVIGMALLAVAGVLAVALALSSRS